MRQIQNKDWLYLQTSPPASIKLYLKTFWPLWDKSCKKLQPTQLETWQRSNNKSKFWSQLLTKPSKDAMLSSLNWTEQSPLHWLTTILPIWPNNKSFLSWNHGHLYISPLWSMLLKQPIMISRLETITKPELMLEHLLTVSSAKLIRLNLTI